MGDQKMKRKGSLYFLIMRGYLGLIGMTIAILLICGGIYYYGSIKIVDKYFNSTVPQSYTETIPISNGNGTMMVRSELDLNNEVYYVTDLKILDHSGKVLYQNSDRSVAELQTEIDKTNEQPISKQYWNYNNAMHQLTIALIVGFLAGELLSMLGFVFRMNQKVSKPLRLLDDAMEQMQSEDLDKVSPIRYQGAQELQSICQSYNRMLNALKTSMLERKQLEEGRQRLIAGISHDLKTPITVIQGYSRAIVDGTIPEERWKRYADTIYRKSVLLTDLINTFHEYSRLEHPDFSFHKEWGDLVEYLREYLAEKYEELSLSHYGLEVNLPEERIDYYFDKVEFRRIFENLINNTMRYNPEGTNIYVSLMVSHVNHWIVMDVADDGIGISEELRQNIFDAFVTGDASRQSGKGSGLGLAIVRRVVEGHGGTITLLPKGAVGHSTTYRIILPRS